jgi:Sec-independent protein secretion pathway component TatC
MEGNILQPGLSDQHRRASVWLMFALFAFGSLFGFVGVLLAVPLTAAIGVLVRSPWSATATASFIGARRADRPRTACCDRAFNAAAAACAPA